MTDKKQVAQAQGAEPTKGKITPISEAVRLINEKLNLYTQFQKLVTQRENLHRHLTKLESLKIPTTTNPFEESESNATEKLVIHLGYREEYEIKNNTILDEVRQFLVNKIRAKLIELDAQILKSSI